MERLRKVSVMMWCHQMIFCSVSKQKTLEELHLTETLGFLSFSIFQWRIWLIWKINQAHWLGWQLGRKANQAEGCLFVMDASDLLPQPASRGRSHSLTSSQHALQIGDQSGTCSEINTVVPHIKIYKFCKASFLFSHVIIDLGLSKAGLVVLFCCNTFNTVQFKIYIPK